MGGTNMGGTDRNSISTESHGENMSVRDHGEIAAVLRAGGYVCREKLGKGAFSEVYRVEDEKGRSFACKVSGAVPLLEREAGIMKELRHPLFPVFYAFWRRGELGYLVMEHVSGCCLETILRRRGGFPPRQVIRMGVELAEGLGYLHERGGKQLFRDVKPANILVRQDGRVKLLDLGCVCPRGRKADSRAGTPGYCAPEQLTEGAVLTEACDVYGLGRTLMDMLSRERRAGRDSGQEPGGGRKRRCSGAPEPDSDGKRRCSSAPEPGNSGKRRCSGAPKPGSSGRGQDRAWRRLLPEPGLRQGQRQRRRLVRLLEVCTRQDPALRIADMRTVIAALLELERGGGTWRQEARCRKNIWEWDCEKA